MHLGIQIKVLAKFSILGTGQVGKFDETILIPKGTK
jgi:hypothetical protein